MQDAGGLLRYRLEFGVEKQKRKKGDQHIEDIRRVPPNGCAMCRLSIRNRQRQGKVSFDVFIFAFLSFTFGHGCGRCGGRRWCDAIFQFISRIDGK